MSNKNIYFLVHFSPKACVYALNEILPFTVWKSVLFKEKKDADASIRALQGYADGYGMNLQVDFF